jgi:hypothetical protein
MNVGRISVESCPDSKDVQLERLGEHTAISVSTRSRRTASSLESASKRMQFVPTKDFEIILPLRRDYKTGNVPAA